MSFCLVGVVCLSLVGAAQDHYEARVEEILRQLTLEEKISLVHGDSKFTTPGIPRFGIPKRWLSDGPHGVREDVGPDTWASAGRTDDFATYMPVMVNLAATWDPEMAKQYGEVIGEEAVARKKHIMLGPGVNIMRTPLNGRNFEYLGEDPWLASQLCVPYIQEVQAYGVASCVKHFAANNQEDQRNSINVEMDDRTLHEIYLPAFRAAVRYGKVWTVMGAYNKFRGEHCCHNDFLLNQILKRDWDFKGLVVSDWAGVHNTKEAVLNGLDLEMGTNVPKYDDYYLGKPFREGIQNGTYPVALLDDKVRRNLRVMIRLAQVPLRDPKPGDDGSIKVFGSSPIRLLTSPNTFNSPAHQAAARKIAEAGLVLLKNENAALPLDLAKIGTIAVIGDNATRKHARGGGSAGIKALYEVTPLEGILNRVGGNVNVTFSAGYRPPEGFRTGPANAAGVRTEQRVVRTSPQELVDQAVQAAKAADVVIYVGGLSHARNGDDEGSDRLDMKLPYGQDELLSKVLEANPRTVVVLMTGAPVEMDPWLPKAPAVLQAWYPGMEGGNAIARTLFGDVNPSGKLPFTYPRRLMDSPAHALGAYPGKDGTETYSEGLLVGYRWFDTKGIEPLFPFGHGLSYTSFGYANPRVTAAGDSWSAQVDLTNSGARDGAEVVQVYVEPVRPKVMRPTRELKGFQKVLLKAGERKTLSFLLEGRAFAYYDPARKLWVADPGEYVVHLGSSSRDLRGRATVRVAREMTFK